MMIDYADVMNNALAVEQAGDDRAVRNAAADRYDQATADVASSLVGSYKTAAAANRAVERDFSELQEISDPAMSPMYERVRYDIIRRIDKIAGPTPAQEKLRTRLVGVGATAGVIALAIIYGSVRHFSATPVTAPLESRPGIEQRAAALGKLLRFDEFGGGRIGGGIGSLLRNVVLWPIEPTESEQKNAGEFAAVILSTARAMADARAACNVNLPAGGPVDDAELDLLQSVTTTLRDPATKWRDPAPATVIEAIQKKYPC